MRRRALIVVCALSSGCTFIIEQGIKAVDAGRDGGGVSPDSGVSPDGGFPPDGGVPPDGGNPGGDGGAFCNCAPWDGGGVWLDESPSVPTGVTLNAVWVTGQGGSTQAWAVGVGVLLHYAGGGWSTLPNQTNNIFYGVWGSGPEDVWAVGEQSSNGLAMHSDGGAFIADEPDSSMLASTPLYGVGGTDSQHVWIVGYQGSIFEKTPQSGGVWQADVSSTANNLNSVSTAGPGDYVWAVGAFTGTNALVGLSMPGQTWTSFSAGDDHALKSVFACDAQHAWAVGDPSNNGWSIFGLSAPTAWAAIDAGSLLNPGYQGAVWAAGPSDVWVGSALGPLVVGHFDGSNWDSADPTSAVTAGGNCPNQALISGISGTCSEMWVVGGANICHLRR